MDNYLLVRSLNFKLEELLWYLAREPAATTGYANLIIAMYITFVVRNMKPMVTDDWSHQRDLCSDTTCVCVCVSVCVCLCVCVCVCVCVLKVEGRSATSVAPLFALVDPDFPFPLVLWQHLSDLSTSRTYCSVRSVL